MHYKVEEVNVCTKKMVFNIPQVDLGEQIAAELKKKQATVSLKGFRKGKAPLAMVEQLYGETLKREALGRYVSQEFYAAIQKEEINPLGYPHFDNLNMAEDNTVTFEVLVEVFPEVELQDFSQYDFKAPSVEITAEEVDQVKTRLLDSKAQWDEAEKESTWADGGKGTIDFKGRLPEGEYEERFSAQAVEAVAGQGQFIPDFEKNFVGMKVGEEKTFLAEFPKDYQQEDLREKKVEFTVSLSKLQVKNLPEFSDDLVKEFDYESVSDFEEKTRKNLKYEKERKATEELHEAILTKFIEDNEFPVPVALLQEQERALAHDMTNNLKRMGMPEAQTKDYLKKWKPELQKKALFQVRSGVILEQLAKQFKLEINEDDYQEKLNQVAENSQKAADDLREHHEKNPQAKKNFQYALREEKTFAQVLEHLKK